MGDGLPSQVAQIAITHNGARIQVTANNFHGPNRGTFDAAAAAAGDENPAAAGRAQVECSVD